MAKPTQKPSAWKAKDLLKLSGRVYMRQHQGQVILQKWPKRRGRPTSERQQAWVDQFSAIAKVSKNPPADQLDDLEEMARGTGWFWRDIITRAAYGKLIVYPGQVRVSVPTARVSRSTSESLTNGVGKYLTPNTMVWDNNSWWSASSNPSRLTVHTSGLYLISAQIQYNGITAGRRDLGIVRNRTDWVAETWQTVANNSGVMLNAMALYYLEAGEYVEVWAFCNVASVTAQLRNFCIIGITPEVVL